MKKPYEYKELSNEKCKVCGKRLKKNLMHKAPHADICHSCKKVGKLKKGEKK